jgi:hypothetical protein
MINKNSITNDTLTIHSHDSIYYLLGLYTPFRLINHAIAPTYLDRGIHSITDNSVLAEVVTV